MDVFRLNFSITCLPTIKTVLLIGLYKSLRAFSSHIMTLALWTLAIAANFETKIKNKYKQVALKELCKIDRWQLHEFLT